MQIDTQDEFTRVAHELTDSEVAWSLTKEIVELEHHGLNIMAQQKIDELRTHLWERLFVCVPWFSDANFGLEEAINGAYGILHFSTEISFDPAPSDL